MPHLLWKNLRFLNQGLKLCLTAKTRIFTDAGQKGILFAAEVVLLAINQTGLTLKTVLRLKIHHIVF